MKNFFCFLILFLSSFPLFSQQGGIGIYKVSGPTNVTINFSANGTGTGGLCDTSGCSGGQVDYTYNGTTTSGTTTGSYPLGSLVTFYPTSSGGSIFSWGSNTLGCGGSSSCTVTITSTTTTAVTHWGSSGGGTIIPTVAGVGYNAGTFPSPSISFGYLRDWDTNGSEWPFIETCGSNNSISTCVWNDSNLVFNYETGGGNTSNSFDTWSADAYKNGVKQLQVTLGSRTPIFITSNPSSANVANCSYAGATGNGKSYGQCYPPSDLPTNGQNSGSCSTPSTEQCDLYFRNWVANFGNHVTSAAYLTGTGSCIPSGGCGLCISAGGCAPPTYLEPFNEPDICCNFSAATFDQRDRMTWDMVQIYNGNASLLMTATSVNGSGVYTISSFGSLPNGASGTYKPSGYYVGYHVNITGCSSNKTNGVISASTSSSITITGTTTSGSCTGSNNIELVNPYTGENAATVQSTVGLSGPIVSLGGPTQVGILTGSYHPQGGATSASMKALECELYCQNSSSSCNTGTIDSTGITQSCSTGGVAAIENVLNMHVKSYNDWPNTAENDFSNLVVPSLNAALDAQELAKPVFNPEASYSSTNFAPAPNAPNCDYPPTTPVHAPPYCNYEDGGMQASFMLRLYIYSEAIDWTNTTYYNWKSTLGSALANAAYTSMYNHMIGTSVTYTSVSSTPGTPTYSGASSNEQVYTYTITYTDASGNLSAFIYDNSQYCTGNGTTVTIAGGCTATTQTVGTSYLSWTPLVNEVLGGTTYNAGTGYAIPQTGGSAHTMPVGVIPVKLCTVSAGSCS